MKTAYYELNAANDLFLKHTNSMMFVITVKLYFWRCNDIRQRAVPQHRQMRKYFCK